MPKTTKDKTQQEMLASIVEDLVTADGKCRSVLVEKLTQMGDQALLQLIVDLLEIQATRNQREEIRYGAILTLVLLGEVGVMEVREMALQRMSLPLKVMALSALQINSHALSHSDRLKLFVSLHVTRATTKDLLVSVGCTEILGLIGPVDSLEADAGREHPQVAPVDPEECCASEPRRIRF